jgi:hypothetical protein
MSTLQATASPRYESRRDDAAGARIVPRFNPRLTARAAGVLSLVTILGGIFAQGLVSNRLISFSDAALTATNILANQSLFETSFTVYLIEMACQIASIALFYRLLRPVNGSVALVAAFVELAGSVIKTLSRVFYIAPLFVLSGNSALCAFNANQLRALALILLRINDRGAALALFFFGVSGVLFGYLIFRSRFLPRALGILGMIGSAGWLRFALPALRFPPFTVIVLIALAAAAVKIFWLLAYGVDEEKWTERLRLSI